MNLFRRRASAPSVTPGERVYVIGDVHGRHDLLIELLQKIRDHAGRASDVSEIHVVQVGDLVDRGPDSARVVDEMRRLQQSPNPPIVLLGNHEEMMLLAYGGDARVVWPWMRSGGDETLRSFGITPPTREDDPEDTIARMRQAIPPQVIEWLRSLPLTARSGGYLFCHAGIRPGVPIKKQSRDDLLWIRQGFLDDQTDHGVVVVHGHSITPAVDWAGNRIGIDTGAYETGVLTALVLEGTERDIIATG